eukprot:TRINITY_DN28638_c0_g1_i1.p1 TRINITY_DN28638_c0_g1~~TRINITY_DN28638_c0_g1_i1.p1  ORF type:complete len:141 (-),score=23.79 TRINITY_DN28638_c0_g1_i1:1004-1426(-)
MMRRLASQSLGSAAPLAFCNTTLHGKLLTGTTNITVAAETEVGVWDHFLVYTASSLVEQSHPAIHRIAGTDSSASQVALIDKDLDFEDLGGHIYWQAPAATDYVTAYSIYLAAGTTGELRSKVGADIPLGTEVAVVFPDT